MTENRPFTRGRHLNHVAWLYDPLCEKLSFGRERRFRERTVEVMACSPLQTILDVGCGTGSLTIMVAQHLATPGRVVGIDAAPKMIAIARRKALAAGVEALAEFHVGVAEALAFADSTFDLVVSSMFTHHLDTGLKELAFAEMYRVLKAGGTMVTVDIDRPSTLAAWLLGWGGRWLLLQKELADNLRGRLPAMIGAAGFVETRRVDHLYGLVSFLVSQKDGRPA